MVVRPPLLALLLVAAELAGAACQSGAIAADAAVDAYQDRDACPAWASCNPVAQTGCQPDQKCTLHPVAETWCPPPPTICDADGEVALGDICQVEPENQLDDCAKPGFCQVEPENNLGRCREICGLAPDTCTAGHCVTLEWAATIGMGLCQPSMLPPG